MGTNWVDEQEIISLEKQVEELTKQRNELLEAAQGMVKALQEEVSLGSDPNVYKCFQANQKLIQTIKNTTS